jgi:TetR/AcrR family transcriptional repressor of bet genes
MSSLPIHERSAREERVDERRQQLAESALATLAELGYARTSLREIAQNSEFTHGVVHYYFTDKVELIIHCVRIYKERCVSRFDDLVPRARTAEALLDGFVDKLVDTLTTEAPLHRLWYDLRTQTLFEESFRDEVLEMDRALEEMIWRIVERYAVLSGKEPALESQAAYALIDGLFENALLGLIAGDDEAPARLAERTRWLMGRIVGG